ncbi:MAG TPA: glycosyltransferase [Methanoregulaceae archaeon]|nr:glycosyltransferase [Methanoregulaceae archaeon]HQJ87273.1 glycosyltransferase [Methanoregulaceae archaeon]
MTPPVISVVIPAYNEEGGIERCLRSLSDQTLPREQFEVIVVDGDSKDRTREIAAAYADRVFIQTSPKVGGARNDGVLAARAALIATTDADCVLPPDWLERIRNALSSEGVVMVYGTVRPIEDSIKNRVSLWMANTLSALCYRTGIMYYTLGCNTGFRKDAFVRAGMYRTIDAGDDLEIARRMLLEGRILFDPGLKVGFSMRRYEQFGTIRSLYQWLYIVLKGGESGRYTYSRREYK